MAPPPPRISDDGSVADYVLPRVPASAGALLHDGEGRILILKPTYKAGWTIPGGQIEEDGESPWEGCRREVVEETGLVVDPAALGEAVHHRVTTFPWGDVVYEQSEDYFVLRVDSHVVDTSGFDDVETAAVIGHRWWDRSDLAATGERYYPRELLELLP